MAVILWGTTQCTLKYIIFNGCALLTTVAYLSVRTVTWASSHLCDGIDNVVPSCTIVLWTCGLLAKKDRFEVFALLE